MASGICGLSFYGDFRRDVTAGGLRRRTQGSGPRVLYHRVRVASGDPFCRNARRLVYRGDPRRYEGHGLARAVYRVSHRRHRRCQLCRCDQGCNREERSGRRAVSGQEGGDHRRPRFRSVFVDACWYRRVGKWRDESARVRRVAGLQRCRVACGGRRYGWVDVYIYMVWQVRFYY